MTAVTMEHTSWCVREHDSGACSSKRGHWDRSTNTWSSDMTSRDRQLIAGALVEWRREKGRLQEVMDHVRAESDTLRDVDNSAILTWNMTQKRMLKKGKSWPT